MTHRLRTAIPSKIGLQTWGSDGDIYPFIALAGGLAAAGHDVTLAITSAERKSYSHLADRLGFRLIQAGYIWKDDEDLFSKSQEIFGAADQLTQLKLLLNGMFQPGVETMYEVSRQLCAGSDFLIGHFLAHPLQLAAEVFGKPYVTVTFNHSVIASRYWPPGPLPNLGPLINPVLWKIAVTVLNRDILPGINALRAKAGAAPVSSFRDVWESRLGNLVAVSHVFFPPDDSREKHHRVCGFFSMPESAQEWKMPEALKRFLSEGPAPVYMTFGSMASIERDPRLITDAARLLVEAAKAARCRAVIQADWEKVTGIPDEPFIYRIGSAPHPQVFGNCAAVVHHGGSGTTQTSLLCGKPSVVVAHILDQYFWGNELKRLGVGIGPLDRRTVSAKKLGGAIRRVLNTPLMAARAEKLGRQLRAENGVAAAVEFIENAFARTLKRS